MKFLITSRLKTGLSATAAMAVGIGVWGFLRWQEARLNSRYVMTTVLCAKKFIGSGKTVDPAWVEEVPIPTAFVPPFALRTRADLKDEKGELKFRTTAACLKGETLATSRLADASASMGLAWAVPAGQSAVTLKLEPEESVGGLLQPGDTVDILSVDKKCELVLSRVRVVAVQDQIWDPAGSRAATKPNAGEPVFVTFVLTRANALRLLASARSTKIFLTLASALDPA